MINMCFAYFFVMTYQTVSQLQLRAAAEVGKNDMSVLMTIDQFPPRGAKISSKNGEVLMNGKRIWAYSVEESAPMDYVSSCTVTVAQGRFVSTIKLPDSILQGLYDVNRSPDNSTLSKIGGCWVDRRCREWQIWMNCSDGGASFNTLLSGSTTKGLVTREDFRDGDLVKRWTGHATLKTVGKSD